MTTETMGTAMRPTRTRARRGTRVWLVAIGTACLAWMTCTTRAEMIDDFNGEPGWDGVNGSPNLQLMEGQLVISQDFTNATDPANPFNTFGNIYYWRDLPVRARQTLELRADLVSANQDNVFAYLITMNGSGEEYVFLKDQNEIGLLKWSATEGCSVAFWESRAILNQNVVLVLNLTPFGDRLVIETKVLRKSTGQVLYQGPVIVDGPGSDWDVPDPLPHGWQILSPDAGAPYSDDLTLVGLAIQHQTDGLQGLAELRMDNLEYDTDASPYLVGGRSALLTWPENTAEEQIVVAAESLSSTVWTPWPEPIYKRFGDFATTAPTTVAQQYFKLVPGTQFIDNFAPPRQPFASRNSWEPWFNDGADASRFRFTITNGVLEIQTLQQPVNGLVMVYPPGGGEIVRDFYASVDILDWGSSTQLSALAIAGRVEGSPGGGLTAMYFGSMQVNLEGVPGTARLAFFDGGEGSPVPGTFSITAGRAYRLQFSAVGSQLTIRLVDLTNGQTVKEGQLQDSRHTQGRVALWVNTRGSTSYTRTVDNFFMTGTKP